METEKSDFLIFTKMKFSNLKERHECVLISLCQQLDFVATNRYDPNLMDKRSLTVAVENHVRFS